MPTAGDFLPDAGEGVFSRCDAESERFFTARPVEERAFLKQREAALRDAAQPPMKNFCRASQTGVELIATQGSGRGNFLRRGGNGEKNFLF